MADFLDAHNLKKEILNLFKDAEKFLILVSPYIKLNDDMKRSLIRKANDKQFNIIIIFGKNKLDLSKSLSRDDMEFFKKFQNVEIFYNQHLHAKYYANDRASIITSINLYQSSFEKNIEIGVLFEQQILNLGKDSKLDSEMFEYMNRIKVESELVYEKTTSNESFFFGLLKGETKQKVHYDATLDIYGNEKYNPKGQISQKEKQQKSGYCIRTGKQIPLNIERPFSYEAYQSWSQYSNPDYKEKFCHFSGEKSDGTICFRRPILKKHWKTAMELIVKLEASKK